MTTMNEKQEMHVRRVKTANTAWRSAKVDSAARARVIAEREVESYRNAMDLEVRQAFEAGVPKAQILSYGLATTNNATINESLARTADLARIQKELANAGVFLVSKEGNA